MKVLISIFILLLSISVKAQSPKLKIKIDKELIIYEQKKPYVKVYEKIIDKDTFIFMMFDDVRYPTINATGGEILTKSQLEITVEGLHELLDPKYPANESTMEIMPGVLIAKTKSIKKDVYWFKTTVTTPGIAEFSDKQVRELLIAYYKYLGTFK